MAVHLHADGVGPYTTAGQIDACIAQVRRAVRDRVG